MTNPVETIRARIMIADGHNGCTRVRELASICSEDIGQCKCNDEGEDQ